MARRQRQGMVVVRVNDDERAALAAAARVAGFPNFSAFVRACANVGREIDAPAAQCELCGKPCGYCRKKPAPPVDEERAAAGLAAMPQPPKPPRLKQLQPRPGTRRRGGGM